jgi:MEDS: MEthanogen/methylotroph, DcmR Sensory domain
MDFLARHQCLIYKGSPEAHLPGLAALIYSKLKTNHRCLFLHNAAMVAGMRSYLFAAGVDVNHELSRGALILSSDQRHLVDGRFDVDSMLALLARAVDQALQDGYAGLWATGDMTWEFGPCRNFDKLVEYEQGLEGLFHSYPALAGICQYQEDTLPQQVIQDARNLHQYVYVNETLSKIKAHY